MMTTERTRMQVFLCYAFKGLILDPWLISETICDFKDRQPCGILFLDLRGEPRFKLRHYALFMALERTVK